MYDRCLVTGFVKNTWAFFIFYKEIHRITLLSALKLFLRFLFAQISKQVAEFNSWPPCPCWEQIVLNFCSSVSLFKVLFVIFSVAINTPSLQVWKYLSLSWISLFTITNLLSLVISSWLCRRKYLSFKSSNLTLLLLFDFPLLCLYSMWLLGLPEA